MNTKEKFKLAHNGNEKIREEIILDNYKLVYEMLKKHFNAYKVDIKDLEQIGLVGLIKAVDTFKEDMGYEFSTYACRCVINEINYYLRSNKKALNNLSYDELITNFYREEDSDISYQAFLVDENTNIEMQFEEKQIKDIIFRIIQNLTEEEKIFLNYIFGLNNEKKAKQKDLAAKYQITQKQVSRRKKQLLEKIRKEILEQEIDIKVKKK